MSGARDGRVALGLLLALAMLAIFAMYYYGHRPLGAAQALAYAGTAGNAALVVLLTGLGGALGWRLLRRWPASTSLDDSGARVVLAAALGWGALALGVLALGLLRLLHAGLLWAVALVLLFVLRRNVWAWYAALARAVGGLAPRGRLDWLCAGFVGFALALGGLQAAAPPLKWDALVYHLALPKLYAEQHSVYVAPADFSLFTGMPQLGEMLFTAAHLLRLDSAAGNQAAQLLGWAWGALLVVGLASMARAHGLPAWLAPAVLLGAFSVAAALAWAYVDLLLMLLALAMLLALDSGRRSGSAGWLTVAGAVGGLAFGCKYTGAIVPLAGAAVVASDLWRCRGHGLGGWRHWQPLAGFALVAALVGAPWLLKNWALYGSPVYPLLLPAADMDAARQWFYSRPDAAERNLLRAALVFPRAVFLGVQGANNYDATLGPLLLLLPLAAALGWRGLAAPLRAALAPWALFAAVGYAAWAALLFHSSLAQQARLFFAILPALALLAAAGWEAARRLDTPALRVSVVLAAGIGLALMLSALELTGHFVSQNPLPYLAGAQPRLDYEVARLGGYPLAMQQVNALPAGARVLFLWEARSLACAPPVRCVPDVVIDRWWHARQASTEPKAALAEWRAAGVTHVLINETGLAFVRDDADGLFVPADWQALDALRAGLRLVSTVGDAYSLYALP